VPGDNAGGFTDAARSNADSIAFTVTKPDTDSDTGSRSAEGRHSSGSVLDADAFSVTDSDRLVVTASERSSIGFTRPLDFTGSVC
jgi:hypothetical protein